MGLSKTEVNLRRLLATAPQQQNQAKLIHYIATLREQLEKLAEERSREGLPRVSKAQLNEYSEKIEAIAAKLAVNEVDYDEAVFLWRVDKRDFLLWIITCIVTLFLGIEIDVLVGASIDSYR